MQVVDVGKIAGVQVDERWVIRFVCACACLYCLCYPAVWTSARIVRRSMRVENLVVILLQTSLTELNSHFKVSDVNLFLQFVASVVVTPC